MRQYKINAVIFLLLFLVIIFKDSMYYFTEKTLKLNNIADAIENSKKTYYEQEYQKVLDLYEIKEFPKYEYEFSKVIYRNIYKYFNEMTILKGKDANLKEHMV